MSWPYVRSASRKASSPALNPGTGRLERRRSPVRTSSEKTDDPADARRPWLASTAAGCNRANVFTNAVASGPSSRTYAWARARAHPVVGSSGRRASAANSRIWPTSTSPAITRSSSRRHSPVDLPSLVAKFVAKRHSSITPTDILTSTRTQLLSESCPPRPRRSAPLVAQPSTAALDMATPW